MIGTRLGAENLGRAIAAVRQYDADVERYSITSRELGTEMLAAHVAAYEGSRFRRFLHAIEFSPGEEPPQIRAHRNELERRGVKTK